jgi:hypothetical protein
MKAAGYNVGRSHTRKDQLGKNARKKNISEHVVVGRQ